MNARLVLQLAALVVLCPTPALASKPPVHVEVIVDGDEEEDFFDEAPPARGKKRSPANVKTVRGRAQDAFDELDGVRVRTQKGTSQDGENTNTQVVNVVIQGNNPRAEAEAAPAAQKPAVAVSVPPAAQATATSEDCDCEEPIPPKISWWRRTPRYADKGDVLLSMGGAWSSAGGMFGAHFEGLPNRHLGVFVKLHVTGFEQGDLLDEDGRFTNFLTNGNWGIQNIDPADISRGFAHITDLGIAWHIFGQEQFEINPTVAISHFGYDIDMQSGDPLRGGSVLLRVGLAANYYWRRFFVGFDVGWYPVELVRYELLEDQDGEWEPNSLDIDDRFNEGRFISSAHIGLKF